MKKMMTLLAITCLFFISCDKSEKTEYNTLKNSEWSLNYLFCLDETREEYFMKPKTQETVWGNFLFFSKNGTFKSYYKSDCGNDLFRTVNGKSKQVSDTEVSISVESVHYYDATSGFPAKEWIEYRDGKPIYFTISKIDNENMLLSKK